MLLKILSYIPYQLTIAATCRRFYELSCHLKSYNLTIYTDSSVPNLKPFSKFLDEPDWLSSILNSQRKIHTLRVTSELYKPPMQLSKLTDIFTNFGPNIVHLYISRRFLTIQTFALLNGMPNLQQLTLRHVGIEGDDDVPEDFQLNLHKLRNLQIDACSEKVLEVMDCLPDNVLHTIDIQRDFKTKKIYFENQTSMKDVISHGPDCLSFTPLKMKRLGTHKLYSPEKIEGQDEMTDLTLFRLTESTLKTICSDLKSLERLMTIVTSNYMDLSDLRNLDKLKIVHLMATGRTLTSFKSRSLRELTAASYKTNIYAETVIMIVLNFPNLQKLHMYGMDKPENVNLILSLCPKLEILICEFVTAKDYKFETFPGESNLKQLSLIKCNNFDEILKLVKSCKKLETFSITDNLTWSSLRVLLLAKPNLKVLCLTSSGRTKSPAIDTELLITLKMFGRNLEKFHWECSNNAKFQFDITADTLRRGLQHKYPGFQLLRDGILTIKKKYEYMACLCHHNFVIAVMNQVYSKIIRQVD